MRNILFFLVSFLLVRSGEATTWYVRTDGGLYGTTASTCNGQTDAAFTGANGPNCGVKHPFEVLGTAENNPRTRRIAAGDTVIIKNGSYKMGWDGTAPYNYGVCYSAWPGNCFANVIPGGVDAANKTKIYGEGWDTGCATKPELWATHGSWLVLDIRQRSNVDLRCLDITDHAQCGGNDPTFKCPGGVDSGSVGIRGYNGANNSFTDLAVHGFPITGISLGRQTAVTMTDVDVLGNGLSGIDQDTTETNDSWSGTNTFTRVKVNWNGCSESYPFDGSYRGCTDQNNSGYGDGWGSPAGGTSGTFTFTDVEFMYNTSDGLDLLYNGDPTSLITVDRGKFEGNVGNSIKLGGGAAIIRNSTVIGNCGFWTTFASKGSAFSPCRAGGNTVVLNVNAGNTYSLVNNTIVGEPDILIELFGCDGGESMNIKNNVLVGGVQYPGTDTVSWLYAYSGCTYSGMTSNASHNIIYAAKEANACTGQSNCLTSDPKLTSFNLATNTFDLRLQAASPAIDYGLDSGTVVGNTTVPTVDINSDARTADEVDLGAYEFGASSCPVITTASLLDGTVGVAYSQTLAAIGGTGAYTWTKPTGTLCSQVTLAAATGIISGTPDTAETCTFTIRATDETPEASCTDASLSIHVAAAAPTITTTTIPDGIVSFVYSATVAASGGTPPYAFTVTAGTICAGLSLASSTGIISGIPTTAETCNFTVTVTDAALSTDTQALSSTITASLETITADMTPGSTSVTTHYGFAGLPYSTVCNVRYADANDVLVATSISIEGPAVRDGSAVGFTPSTNYTATYSCDTPSGELVLNFTTLPAQLGAVDWTYTVKPHAQLVARNVEKVSVEYNLTGEVVTAQDASCATGCTLTLPLTTGQLYQVRHIWLTAADAVVATSRLSTVAVP